MKLPRLGDPALREESYEAMFYVVGLVGLALRPTLSGGFQIQNEIDQMIRDHRILNKLEKRGLVEMRNQGAERILRLTDLGSRAFDGGRNPEEAWNRPWDGQWRLVVFDLPREARAVRAKFWRWLRGNNFGRFQGSVWITPDPVPEIEEAARDAGLDSSMFMVFTGQVDGKTRPRELAGEAWDFEVVNEGFQSYRVFAERVIKQVRSRRPSLGRLNKILREDRKQWWQAIHADPLLPKKLCPQNYAGFRTWKVRQKLHAALFRTLDFEKSS